jgi:CMP-N,N'-diacetyllegionaminic acid synthase
MSDIVAIIPARGGSKRLPGKNLKEMHGKPLIAWTIEKAQESSVFKKIIVMTDDSAIAQAAETYGDIEVFRLSPELATDTTYVGEAIEHMLKEYEQKGERYEDFILLEPTSPGRTAAHIQEVAHLMLEKKQADSIVGITELPPNHSPSKALSMDSGQFVTRASDGALLKNLRHLTQFVEPTYYINSSIYACRYSNFQKGSLWGDTTLGYVMNSSYSFNIDTQDDWELAEYKMGKLLSKQ